MATRNQAQHAQAFADLHKPGEPLLLPNAWDVASAVAIAGAGLGAERAAAVIARIVSTRCTVSEGFIPAAGSSSMTIAGAAASARAISSRR